MTAELMLTSGDYQLSEGLMLIPDEYNKEAVLQWKFRRPPESLFSVKAHRPAYCTQGSRDLALSPLKPSYSHTKASLLILKS